VLVTLRRRRAHALLVLVLTLAMIATLIAASGRAANAARVDGKPPPNPTDGQINSAEQQKANLAAEVGRLGAEVVRMQTQIHQLKANAELAEQKYVYALSKLQQAQAASVLANKAVTAADARVAVAQRQYDSFVSATYMSGDIGGTTGAMLTAEDPNVVLQQSALEQYESDHQLDAIGSLKTATVERSNADAAARKAVLNQHAATVAADKAKQDAIDALQTAKVQEQQLKVTLAANQRSLSQAQEQLATLNHQRAAYIKYQRHQAALRRARIAARRAAAAAARAAARAAALAAARKQAAEARRRAREAAHHPDSGGSSPVGGGSPVSHPSGGAWSQAKANRAVARARNYLGWMYAWAGGNASGPTYGVCAGDGAWNDCHVLGFDCSGLSLYAWAPSMSLPHYAASQYYAAGSVHPSIGSLRPGDLTFWSANGSASGIHHVAIYIGGGDVIQAPQSGSPIQITPLGQVDWGYFGATRPLT
jgi:cell wall-associated NlpC family hydrolase